MRGSLLADTATAADAYMAWWSLAGVDCAVQETPVNWLRPFAVKAATAKSSIPDAASPVPPARPDTLDAFQSWLATDASQPERSWTRPPIQPVGQPGAALMVVTDMPDATDMAAGQLLSDRSGALFDAMLRAIGLDRSDIYLTALTLARPPGGMLEAGDIGGIVERMRAHVALAAPRHLLILGDRTIRALLPTDGGMAADGLRPFNHDGGIVPAVATFHPRLLLSQPAAKAECWRHLQSLLIEEQHP
jgi:uracil-DNA glycosylase family 4